MEIRIVQGDKPWTFVHVLAGEVQVLLPGESVWKHRPSFLPEGSLRAVVAGAHVVRVVDWDSGKTIDDLAEIESWERALMAGNLVVVGLRDRVQLA